MRSGVLEYPDGSYSTCSRCSPFRSVHFFESHCEVQKYALAYEPWDGSNVFPYIFFEFGDVRGFIGIDPVFQLVPKTEIWRAQVRTMGRPFEFCLQTNHACSLSHSNGLVSDCQLLFDLYSIGEQPYISYNYPPACWQS